MRGNLGIESGLREDVAAAIAASARQELGQSVERGLRQTERLADVAHRRARAVADDVGHHGGVVAPVLLVDVLDHLLAPLVLDVEIDVRRLGALPGQEALEEQAHAHRIDGGDAEAVADRRVRGRASALAEDPPLPAETRRSPTS